MTQAARATHNKRSNLSNHVLAQHKAANALRSQQALMPCKGQGIYV